ncbi:MAG: FadR/GntR family transcriptional regulator [Alphaproteobacteria bacterium]
MRPVAPQRNLTRAIADSLAAEIKRGKLPPGARLPTEQEMVAAMGVSRTVVREAVAALRAEGLVVTRQGAGAFVASDIRRRPFRIAGEGQLSVDDVLAVMELRASVEAEAAGLAAERATAAARRRIVKALAAIDAAIKRGESAVDEDFAFHRAIAAATGNPQFAHFLEYLGRFIIPRQSIRVAAHQGSGQRAYLEMIQREHRAIFAAIEAGEAKAAREAMRRHLANSQARYRRFADQRPLPLTRRTAQRHEPRGRRIAQS